jgi:hypothetical protein
MALQINSNRSLVTSKLAGAILAIFALVVQPLASLNIPAVFADAPVDGVVINEFNSYGSSGDWVELYNTTDSSISLNGWKVEDSSSKIADLDSSLNAHGFLKISVGKRLNGPGDIITLIHDNNHKTSVAYGDATDAVVAAPGDGETAGHLPDGTGAWQIMSVPTPGAANQSNVVTPVPSLEAEDFDTWDNSPSFEGFNVGFAVKDFGKVTSVTVDVTRADDSHVTKTAGSAMLSYLSDATILKQASAPLIIQPGTYDETTDTYWNPQAKVPWTDATKPKSVTITVVGENGTKSVTNNTFLAGDSPAHPAYESMLPLVDQAPTIALVSPTPVENALVGDSIDVGYEATDDHGFKAVVVGLYDTAGATYLRDCTMATNMAVIHYAGTCSINTSGLSTGNYTIEARVQDSSGAYGTEARRVVFIDRTAPEVSFISPTPVDGSHLATNFTASFAATDNYQLRNITAALYNTDGSPASTDFYAASNLQVADWAATYNFDIGGLADGTYILKLRAQDMAGNYATDAVRTIRLDRTAPTVPTQLLPINRGYSKANDFYFDWTDSDDESPVTYEFQSSQNSHTTNDTLDTGVWNNIASGNAEQKNLLESRIHSTGASDGVWYWQVRAIDAAGNKSSWTPVWKMTLDTNAPTTTIAAPKDLVGNTFTVSGDAKDNLSLNRVYVQLVNRENGKRYGGTTIDLIGKGTDAPWSVNYDASKLNLPDGKYAAHVSVVDMAGNTGSAGWTDDFTVDTTAPIVKITAPSNGDVLQGTVTVSGTTDPDTDHYWLVALDTDGKVVKGSPGTVSGAAIQGWHWDTTKVPDGTYTIRLEARDKAGNKDTGSVGTIAVEVKNTPEVVGDYFRFKTNNLNVGFTPVRFTDATAVTVTLYDKDDNAIAAQTLNSQLVTSLVNNKSSQISSPFYLDGTVDSAWRGQVVDWTTIPTPAYAVVTVAYGNGHEAKSGKIDFIASDDLTGQTYGDMIAYLNDQKSQKEEEGATMTTTDSSSLVLPITLSFSNFARIDTSGGAAPTEQGQDSASTDGDTADKPAVLGTQDKTGTPLASTAVLGAQSESSKIFGLTWQWWLIVLAALVVGWLVLAAIIRRARGKEI